MSRKRYLVKLNSVEDVQYFNAKLCTLDGDFDLGCGRYVIDAKSIMGIFSLDLSKPIDCTFECDCDAFRKVLKRFEVK